FRKRPSVMSAISRNVEHRHMSQRVVRRSPVLDKPASELLDGPQVVVAGLDALALLAEARKESLNSVRRDVSDERNVAALDDPPRARRDELDLLRADPLGFQVLLEVSQVLTDGPLAMLIESIHDPCGAAFGFLDQFVQHRLSSCLVHGQGNAPFDTVLVA